MEWEVYCINKFDQERVVAITEDWFHAHRLVEGVTKLNLDHITPMGFNKPFEIQWYKEFYGIRKHNE